MTDRNGAERAPDEALDGFQPRNPARRCRKTSVVTLHLEPDELEKLRGLAYREGISLREFLRQAVWYAVARMGEKL